MRLFLFVVLLWSPAAVKATSLVEKHPQRDFIERSLQRLVDKSGKATENHFFVFRKKQGDDWIYWREGRLLWATDLSPYYEKKGPTEVRARAIWDLRLFAMWKPIELDSGVVLTRDEIGGSSYLVTRDFVAGIIYDCVLNGEMLVLTKKPPNSEGSAAPQRAAGPRLNKPVSSKD